MDSKNGREDTKLEPADEKLVVLLRVILVPWPEKTSGTVNGKNHSHPPATEVLTSMDIHGNMPLFQNCNPTAIQLSPQTLEGARPPIS